MGRGKIFINWAEFKSGINQIQEHIFNYTLRTHSSNSLLRAETFEFANLTRFGKAATTARSPKSQTLKRIFHNKK